MSLAKARIEILDSEALDITRGLTKFIDVQFNPADYSITKGAQIAEIAIPGLDTPILQFIRGKNEQLTLDLFFVECVPCLILVISDNTACLIAPIFGSIPNTLLSAFKSLTLEPFKLTISNFI